MTPDIDTSKYSYELPDERIAKYPLPQRDSSKLLIYNDNKIDESVFSNIGKFLPGGATLVFNNTKVIRARLKFNKQTGANIEIFCLEPVSPAEIETAFAQTHATTWQCIVGNSKKWKDGALLKIIDLNGKQITLEARRAGTHDNTSDIAFSWDDESVTFSDIIEAAGLTPIPPYLNRETESIDTVRYQTVYSQHKGSVAAPTAGLHFTEQILSDLQFNNHKLLNLTLHVGAGTFKPIQTDNAAQHVMHTEHFVVTADFLDALTATDAPVVAVGTTSVRTLESIYWLGVRAIENRLTQHAVEQWEPYERKVDYSARQALGALAGYMKKNAMQELHGTTQIMIVPGYDFKTIDALITNFHQPHSTLLLLIAALVGEDWRTIYNYALTHDFRFLSYGDSSLLFRKKG